MILGIAVLAVFAALQVLIQNFLEISCRAVEAVAWSYVGLLVLLRLCVVVETVAFFIIRDPSLRPTWKAKILLLIGIVLNVGEDLPSFVTHPGLVDQLACVLRYASIHDLLQLLALLSLPFLILFIRDQFKRIEQVCRHQMIFEVAKQLDNHDTVSISSAQSDTVVLTKSRNLAGLSTPRL
jgi:hypothetical protein